MGEVNFGCDELAQNEFDVEQTGITLVVNGIEKLASYAEVTFKKNLRLDCEYILIVQSAQKWALFFVL